MTESAGNYVKFKLDQFFPYEGKSGMVRRVNSMGRNPLLHSLCFVMSSSTRCSAGQNTLMVDQALQDPADGGADGITWAEKENSYPQYVYIE